MTSLMSIFIARGFGRVELLAIGFAAADRVARKRRALCSTLVRQYFFGIAEIGAGRRESLPRSLIGSGNLAGAHSQSVV